MRALLQRRAVLFSPWPKARQPKERVLNRRSVLLFLVHREIEWVYALHGDKPECRKVKRYVTSPKLCLGEVEARARARLREGAFRDADLRASVTGPLPQSRLNASPATSPKQSLGEVTRLSLRHSRRGGASRYSRSISTFNQALA